MSIVTPLLGLIHIGHFFSSSNAFARGRKKSSFKNVPTATFCMRVYVRSHIVLIHSISQNIYLFILTVPLNDKFTCRLSVKAVCSYFIQAGNFTLIRIFENDKLTSAEDDGTYGFIYRTLRMNDAAVWVKHHMAALFSQSNSWHRELLTVLLSHRGLGSPAAARTYYMFHPKNG